MSGEIIDALCDKIFAHMDPESAPIVVWHAGEPTTAPIQWYEHAYSRLLMFAPPQTSFAMQSNGIAINDNWIELFRRTNTNVSLSIDGPQRFHDARRRTRNNKPTWQLGLRALKRLKAAGFDPGVISVLHPDGLDHSTEYYSFYRDHGITQVSFSIDEMEGANRTSSFARTDLKAVVSGFLISLLEQAYADRYPLQIREIERIAQKLAGVELFENEQVEPWAAIVVAADGSVSTFSPEFMEANAPAYNNFVFGNILTGNFDDFAKDLSFVRASRDISQGIQACSRSCKYFSVCGGGSPVNKFSENGDMNTTETNFCRLTTQSSADALLSFLSRRKPSEPRNPIH